MERILPIEQYLHENEQKMHIEMDPMTVFLYPDLNLKP